MGSTTGIFDTKVFSHSIGLIVEGRKNVSVARRFHAIIQSEHDAQWFLKVWECWDCSMSKINDALSVMHKSKLEMNQLSEEVFVLMYGKDINLAMRNLFQHRIEKEECSELSKHRIDPKDIFDLHSQDREVMSYRIVTRLIDSKQYNTVVAYSK